MTEGDEEVAFAGPGGADEAHVLPGGDPFERAQVVERGGLDRRRGDVELLEGLGHGEPGRLHAVPGVGRVSGGDLGFDESPEELLGRPALRLRGDDQLGSEAPHGAHPQAPQTGLEIGGEDRGRGGHVSPIA